MLYELEKNLFDNNHIKRHLQTSDELTNYNGIEMLGENGILARNRTLSH